MPGPGISGLGLPCLSPFSSADPVSHCESVCLSLSLSYLCLSYSLCMSLFASLAWSWDPQAWRAEPVMEWPAA